MTLHPMMKCGHAANATNTKTGTPSCVICVGIHPGAEVVDTSPPALEGRTAKCDECRSTAPSSTNLAFFEHRPGDRDKYYCGCHGWE